MKNVWEFEVEIMTATNEKAKLEKLQEEVETACEWLNQSGKFNYQSLKNPLQLLTVALGESRGWTREETNEFAKGLKK